MGVIIHDLSDCELSVRNGSYGGMAGYKEGIKYMGEMWVVKYPKNISNIKEGDGVYASSPLSEFIGSHIYQMLGIPVHDTLLGYRNGKLVVACRDFVESKSMLLEIRTLKNLANKDFEKQFDRPFGSTGSSHVVDWEELLLHIEHNPVMSKVAGLWERFIMQAIVDILINNNDRNNGNWGVLRRVEGDTYIDCLAPIYDNGACFSPNLTEAEISSRMNDVSTCERNSCNTVVAYGKDGKNFTARKFCEMLATLESAKHTVYRVSNEIDSKMISCIEFIRSIPNTITIDGKTVEVMSELRKDFYILQLESRYRNLIQKELVDRILSSDKLGNYNILCSLAENI